MVYEYRPVDDLVNGSGMDLSILNDLANNDDYFNRVIPNMSYRWLGKPVQSNSGGVTRVTAQGGTVLVPQFKGDKGVDIVLNRAGANNSYPISVSIRHAKAIKATTTVTTVSPKGFHVVIHPLSPNVVNNQVYLTWLALVPLAN